MPEYFVVANSFAAPMVSDQSLKYMEADSPQKALARFKREYDHPCGLYAVAIYLNADAYHKDKKCLRRWLCSKAKKEVNSWKK